MLEIGAGSGLLSIIAASLGAKCVVAIEANRHLADVATEIIKRNGYEGRIHIINRMSTDVTREEVRYLVVAPPRCSSTATLTCCSPRSSARFCSASPRCTTSPTPAAGCASLRASRWCPSTAASLPDRVENELALASASWLSGGVPEAYSQRQSRPRAAPRHSASLGQPAAWSALAGRTGLALDRRRFASLVQSADINSITSVKCWEGIDLRWFNTLQDTTSMV